MEKVDWLKLKEALDSGRKVTLKIGDDEISIECSVNGGEVAWLPYVNGWMKGAWLFASWCTGEEQPAEPPEAKYYPIKKKLCLKKNDKLAHVYGKRHATNLWCYYRFPVFGSAIAVIRHYKQFDEVYFISVTYSCV